MSSWIFIERGGFLYLRRDGEEDGLGDEVHQGGEHPLLELEVPEVVKLVPQLVGHQELAEQGQVDVVTDTPEK